LVVLLLLLLLVLLCTRFLASSAHALVDVLSSMLKLHTPLSFGHQQ
jgi:hypothetical protein